MGHGGFLRVRVKTLDFNLSIVGSPGRVLDRGVK